MNWDDAIAYVHNMSFPNDKEGWKDVHGKDKHTKGKTFHQMTTSSKYLNPIGDYELEAKYNYCRECGDVRNKALRLFNNEEGQVYTKWFKFQGKAV